MDTVQHEIPLSNDATVTVTVTNQFGTIREWIWIREVRNVPNSKPAGATVVGLACRRNPYSANKKTATVQVCWNDKCLVVQLHHCFSFRNWQMQDMFEDSKFIFAAADISDFAKLRDEYKIVIPKEVDITSLPAPPGKFNEGPWEVREVKTLSSLLEDLGIAKCKTLSSLLEDLGIAKLRKPYEQLAERLLALKIDRPSYVEGSDWGARILTYGQVKHACIDAYLAYRVGCFIINEY